MTYRFAMSCFWAGLAFDELEVSGQGVSRGGGGVGRICGVGVRYTEEAKGFRWERSRGRR